MMKKANQIRGTHTVSSNDLYIGELVAQNNPYTTSTQLQKHFEKFQKTALFGPTNFQVKAKFWAKKVQKKAFFAPNDQTGPVRGPKLDPTF